MLLRIPCSLLRMLTIRLLILSRYHSRARSSIRLVSGVIQALAKLIDGR